MSVERMEMMNVIGHLDELDKVSIELIRNGSVHIVNALNEINQNNFTIMTPEQNTNALVDLCFIKPYSGSAEYSSLNDRITELMDIFSIEKGIRKRYVEKEIELEDFRGQVNVIYEDVVKYRLELEKIKDELSKIREFQDYLKNIREVKLDFDILKGLKFFNYRIGKLSKDNYEKLKDNIENISSLIYEISSVPGAQIILSITPKVLINEVDRILQSLNFEEIEIPYGLAGTPEDIIRELDVKISEKEEKNKKLDDEIGRLRGDYCSFIDQSYSTVKLLEKAQTINSEAACTNEFFYMAGWVPVSEEKGLSDRLSKFGDRLILTFKHHSEVGARMVPPTRLKNNWFVRPFEALVRMYGVPSYNELDPTAFVAISYMIMFGCMFGDLGQGFIFLAAGLVLSKKFHRPNLGGVLSRIGGSSMIFGILFGSVFGNEKLIKPLLFYPMENINLILMAGIGLGVIFTTVGFIYSLLNAIKRKNIEEGVFGKDGLVGFLFYWIILLTALSVYNGNNTIIPVPAIIIVLCILLGFMVVKKPVTNMITGHKPLYDESVGDYYIESGFGIVETLLSMLSNTISFIRVGAFALNHVGLFVAFATVAQMMKNSVAGFGMLVLGNIIIIGLEGLIVFIQGLRLEYYELFSKYYEGSGIEFAPVRLQYTRARIDKTLSSNDNIRGAASGNIIS